jgi:ABC-type multidrug transport system ATPase subunit
VPLAVPPAASADPGPLRRLRVLGARVGAMCLVELQKLRRDQTELLTRAIQPALWLLIFAKLYGVGREKRTRLIAELLESVELTQWRDKPVKMLSGGMRRRVEIARGLVHEPRVFFLDEPTTGLDPVSRTAVWEMVDRVRKAHQLTVLVTTHYMDEADKMCDRIAIVDHGGLVVLDTPANLKASIPGANERTTLDEVFVHYTGNDLRDAAQAPSVTDSPFMLRR